VLPTGILNCNKFYRGQIWETIFLSKIPSASFVIPARTEPIRKEEKGRGGEGGIIKETILIRLVFYYSTKRKLFLTYVYIIHCVSKLPLPLPQIKKSKLKKQTKNKQTIKKTFLFFY
jgi:hypothetical protein